MPRWAWAFLMAGLLTAPLWAERRIAVIIDTSGSMNWNDHSRYAEQISKILSDLTDDRDKIAVIRFPRRESKGLLDLFRQATGPQNCDVGADPSMMVQFAGSDRATFKPRVEALLEPYEGPTYFGSPLRTAISFLGEERSVQRLLLLISDAQEGFGECKQQYTQLLQGVGGSGSTVALIKIGGYSDDGFANNPAIQFRQDVHDSQNLISAVAQVYQRFLGSKQTQTGQIAENITVQIDPHVKEAFLVVAADSPIGSITADPGNPAAKSVDLDYRGGGETRGVGQFPASAVGAAGVDDQTRGYRIVRLAAPTAGTYRFGTPTGTTGGWMLLEDYALELRMITQTVPLGATSQVQLEVIDQTTGQRVTDASTLEKLRVEGNIESSSVSLTNNGSGVFTIDHQFGDSAEVPVQMRLQGGSIDRTFNATIHVSKNAPKPEPPAPASPPMLAGPNDLEFGRGQPINFGRLTPGSERETAIQLLAGRVAKELDVEISTDLNKRHMQLEIWTAKNGWRALSDKPVMVRLVTDDPMRWPLRLRLQECPQACSPNEAHKISFVARHSDGGVQNVEVPISADIIPDPWYICWRRELFAALVALVAGLILHGYVSPYRFARRVGVQMSGAEDLNEGYYFPLRAAAGSGAGFYRHATLFMTEDFRVTKRKRGGFVRLRAYKNQVRMRPENGRLVWRQQADGSWEQVSPSQDVPARPGVLFRNDAQTLYFEVRTK